MNHLLVLSLLVGLVCSVNGEFELENICRDSVFEFKGYTVNSFYVIEKSLQLDKLDDMLVGDDSDPLLERWAKNEADLKEVKEQKTKHNRIIKQIYREAYIDTGN